MQGAPWAEGPAPPTRQQTHTRGIPPVGPPSFPGDWGSAGLELGGRLLSRPPVPRCVAAPGILPWQLG